VQVLGQARALQDGVESARGKAGGYFWVSNMWASFFSLPQFVTPLEIMVGVREMKYDEITYLP
jgi:hypothetical protein